jgi:hypothetical protein
MSGCRKRMEERGRTRVERKSIAESTVEATRDMECERSTTPILAPRRRMLMTKLRLMATEEGESASAREEEKKRKS